MKTTFDINDPLALRLASRIGAECDIPPFAGTIAPDLEYEDACNELSLPGWVAAELNQLTAASRIGTEDLLPYLLERFRMLPPAHSRNLS